MKDILKKLFYTTIAGMALLPRYVQGESGASSPGFTKVIGFKKFEDVIAAVLDVVVQIGVIVVVLAIIYAGFLFVTAQGSDDKIEKAKRTFFWVVIGAIVVLGANALSDVIKNTAGEIGVGLE